MPLKAYILIFIITSNIAVEVSETEAEPKPATEEPKKEPAVVAWYR